MSLLLLLPDAIFNNSVTNSSKLSLIRQEPIGAKRKRRSAKSSEPQKRRRLVVESDSEEEQRASADEQGEVKILPKVHLSEQVICLNIKALSSVFIEYFFNLHVACYTRILQINSFNRKIWRLRGT